MAARLRPRSNLERDRRVLLNLEATRKDLLLRSHREGYPAMAYTKNQGLCRSGTSKHENPWRVLSWSDELLDTRDRIHIRGLVSRCGG